MKPQAIAFLVVRCFGLILVIWCGPLALASLGQILQEGVANWFGRLTFSPLRGGFDLANVAPPLQAALGVYMLLGGKRLVRLLLRGLPGVPGICERCGYDIAGLEGGRCPECGAKIPERS